MTTARAHVVDRTGWPDGPWNDEPDKVQFRTQVGLPALIVRNWLGGLCGYVGVGRDHPLYGQDYDTAEVDVHGGLTYSDHCQKDSGICHIPEHGESDDVWWLGFDCGHFNDVIPQFRGLEVLRGWPPIGSPQYRDLAYVRNEVESLARQLAALQGADR